MTPGQSASSRGRKFVQITIKPEAADASTQTSQADLEAPSAPSPSAQAAATDVPPEVVECPKSRRKEKQIIGKAYSKEERECENCKASGEEGDGPALEGITPLVAPVTRQERDGAPGSSRDQSDASDDPLGWQPVGEVITTTTIVCGASSSYESDSDVSEGMQCENDGCHNRVGDWSYPECTSCWYEHN